MNNPAIFAYSRVKQNYPEAQDPFLLSLGTGEVPKNQREHAQAGGAFSWGTALLDVMLGGVSKVNHDLMENFLGKGTESPRQYYRLQAEISEDLEPMDKTSPEHISALVAAGKKFTLDHEAQLDAIVLKLKGTQSMARGGLFTNSLEEEMCQLMK